MNSSTGSETGGESSVADGKPGFWVRGRQWAWFPLPILLIAVIGAWLADLRTPIESPALMHLRIGLNFVFSTLVAMLIAFTFGRSFRVHNVFGLLLFGCGAVIWGASGIVSLVTPLVTVKAFDANTAVTIHNVCIWFASLSQTAGAAIVSRHGLRVSTPKSWLLGAYGLAVGIVGLTVLATLWGWTPVFFAPGVGGTPVRWSVLASTIGMLVLTSVLLWPVKGRQRPSLFLQWYLLSLLLLMVGYLALMLESVFAGLLGWVGAAAQYLGGAYMFVAAIVALRENEDPLFRLSQPQDDARNPYPIAIASVLTAAVLRLVFLQSLGTAAPFITFYPAVMLAALYGGLRAGALATVTSAASAGYFWMEPVGNFFIERASDRLSLAIFVANGVLVSWIADRLRNADSELRRSEAAQRQELERLVAERTAELEKQIAERRGAEEAAQNAEQQHRLILDNMSEGIMLFDPQGNCIYQNTASLRIHGHAPVESGRFQRNELPVLYKGWDEAGRPLSFEQWPIARVCRQESFQDQVVRALRVDTGHEWIGSYNGCPVCGTDGKLKLGFVTIRETSKQVLAEEALRQSEERLRLALSAGRMATWQWDLATDACIWNDEHYRILGYEPGSVTPSYEAWAQRVLPEDLARTEAGLREMVERGIEYVAEYRVLGEKGDVRWVEARGQRQRDKEDRFSSALGVMLDVTKRKLAEDALLSSQKQLQAFLENSALIAWLKDEEGRYVFVSENHYRRFGRRPEDTIGRTDLDMWPRAVAEEFRKNDLAVLASEAPIEVVEPAPNPDGSTCWWLSNKFHYRDATGRRYVGGLGVDITERKLAELALVLAKAEAERANLAKSKFLAAASHDLRQPVQSLTLLLSTIKGQVKDMPRTAKTVAMAKSAVDSLNGLLTGILDISKLDAGVVAPTIESVNLGEITERLAKEYASRAAAAGLTLRHVPSPLRARTDAALMDRIVRNLIENALRYTKKGGILIGLRLRGDKVRLDVIDTGIGIPADKQTEIFEEFRQLDNPARDASRGLGLGLAIVSRISRLLGAPMEVASRVGRGTRFSLLFPLDLSEAPAMRAAPAFGGAGGRILVIEDDALIRQTYEMMLEDWGYEMLSAASGEEALDRAARAEWGFDAIMADHRLGSGLTGNAAAKEIARRAGRSYPTVVVTGDTAKERLAEISGSGFITLHKPVEAEDLRRTLASLLPG